MRDSPFCEPGGRALGRLFAIAAEKRSVAAPLEGGVSLGRWKNFLTFQCRQFNLGTAREQCGVAEIFLPMLAFAPGRRDWPGALELQEDGLHGLR
jgi:hypothetical protein